MEENTEKTTRRIMVYDVLTEAYIKLLAELSYEKNWTPVHWFGSLPEHAKRVHKFFPDVQYHSKKEVIRRKFPETVPSRNWPRRDINVVKKLAVHDPVLYPVFLREARNPYGMDQLSEYYNVITTWYYFFEYVNPDLLVYSKVPAHIYDYLPYLLCQERGIPTLLLLKHHHVPSVIMPANRFEEPPPRIASSYRELINTGDYHDLALADEWEEYFNKMRGTYEQAMYKDFNRRYSVNSRNDRVSLKDTIPRKLVDVITGRRSVFYARALAREILTLHRRRVLRWVYNRKAIKPDYKTPYIFVPLHVQPERTSIPQGDIFGHQLFMIEILSRTLPKGWLLYVKEHPVQLYDRPVFRFFRTPAFYKEVLRFENVRLVPADISARKLINHAKAIAAVTSTTCWEALFLEKPSLVFGHVWFNFCDAVYYTPDYDSCKRAIKILQQGYVVDKDKLRAALYVLQQEKNIRIADKIDNKGLLVRDNGKNRTLTAN